MIYKDVVIVGAGAAGLMCAIESGRRGRSVSVIEHSEKIGKKILISGGGRCNFTNIYSSHENFISQNPHFCKSALANYSPDDFISLVKKHKIAFHEKKLGQLFCNESSREIVRMLESECKTYSAEIKTSCRILNIEINEKGLFEVATTSDKYVSESLVIASGGISIPKMGASGFGYDIAKKFGHGITKVSPGLVPFVFKKNDRDAFGKLSGVSVDSIVSSSGVSFRENILFTHGGLSGPAILQISNYWKSGDCISINLFPEKNLTDILIENLRSRTELVNFISNFIPSRLAAAFCEEYFSLKNLNRYSKKELKTISEKFHKWEIVPEDTEGFGKAEVTLGGVDTSELNSKTMESKKINRLYFIGEVVDVTGWLGGYNFQWAWSSGFAAGQYA